MLITILIPHWKVGKMLAVCVSKLLQHKGHHEMDIIVIDNNPGDGSVDFINQYLGEGVTIIDYPKDRLQSHGIAFDYVIPHIRTEYFITLESDSFPIQDNWLDYYENLINQGYDCAGPLLRLSGGEYVHPCGSLYKTNNWIEARNEISLDIAKYAYFPSIAVKDNHSYHLMVHHTILKDFMVAPGDYVELSERYKPHQPDRMVGQMLRYIPVCDPFHNGMGANDDSFFNYGERTASTESPYVNLNEKKKLIFRIGLEPGQWLYYWHIARGKKCFEIEATTRWMKGYFKIQQEYSQLDSGIMHLWGVSSYHEAKTEIALFKKDQVDEAYRRFVLTNQTV